MMKIVVVYLGQASIPNFAHSMQSGVWGFKNNAQPEQPISEGDLLFFASGYTGKNIRLPEDKWLPHSITLVATAVVTSQLSKIETSPHWPDETAANRILYPRRFTFENLTRNDGRFALDDAKLFPRELSLALRKAAIGGKAQVVEIPTLPEWLTDGAPPPKVPAQPTPPVRPAPTKPTPQRSIGDTLLEIENYVASRGFVFPNRILRAFYASLRSKPFVILAGNSGTGKSRLVRLFAEASGATVANGRFTMIPVRPDWNDSSELLGYFDLNGDFNPGQLIAPILMAHRNPVKPFFVCLDEMNLAKVEHYFSDFLSIIESRGRSKDRIVTDPILLEAQLKKVKADGLRPEAQAALNHCRSANQPIGLPENLFIVGTVNMDETTQPFIRKVLDRAHTLEFNDIDLLQGLDEEVTPAEVPALELDQAFFKPEFTCLNDVLSKHREKAKEIAAFIDGLNGELAFAGFEVGYRVRDEAISFAAYATEGGLTKADVDEAIVLQKILPRIQGSSPRVGKLLHSLLQRLKGDVDAPQLEDPNFDQRLAELRSDGNASAIVRKIAGMLLIFREENFTSFWLV
jgi:energy-coupling factor transporter ATP-binding protein EcfA2